MIVLQICGFNEYLKQLIKMSSIESLKTHLSIVKQLPADKIEQEFYNLMIKAKDTLGETSYHMAPFYYQYGHFIMSKLQKNMDIFNAEAVPNNVNEEAEEDLDHIPEVYDDSESQPQFQQQSQQPEIQNIQPIPQHQQNQQSNHAQQSASNQPNQQRQNQVAPEQPEQDLDDKEVSLCNLEFAISIFQTELEKVRNFQSQTSMKELLDGIRKARSRLGDLFMLDEEYAKAIDEYRQVITQQQKRQDAESNRLIAELHFLIGNCFLYDNKSECENLAIQEFIKAISILVNNLSLVEHYDISNFQIPSKGKYKVDRFAYLNRPDDSDQVKEIKDIIACLLDKVEDTSEQIVVKIHYEKEKKKEEQEKKKSQFKPVDQNAKVIHLGNFGNRKKKPQEGAAKEKSEQKKE